MPVFIRSNRLRKNSYYARKWKWSNERYKRKVSELSAHEQDTPPNNRALLECDTNADTHCLAKNFVVSWHTSKTANFYAYDISYEPIESYLIVTGMIAYDDQRTYQTYILVFHESLHYGSKLDHGLVYPYQLRHYGIEFNDRSSDIHNGLNIIVNDKLTIDV